MFLLESSIVIIIRLLVSALPLVFTQLPQFGVWRSWHTTLWEEFCHRCKMKTHTNMQSPWVMVHSGCDEVDELIIFHYVPKDIFHVVIYGMRKTRLSTETYRSAFIPIIPHIFDNDDQFYLNMHYCQSCCSWKLIKSFGTFRRYWGISCPRSCVFVWRLQNKSLTKPLTILQRFVVNATPLN